MKYQTLFKEYIWLVNTIAKQDGITLEEINRRWCQTEMSGGVEMARSTFNRHKDAIEEIFGLVIDCDRKNGYKYYIDNVEELKRETIQNWMLSTMTVNNLLADQKSIHHRVLLEAVPSSDERLENLLEAMKQNRKVKIFYQKSSQEPGKERLIEPFCVKLYKRRWYALARIESGEMRCFSLDRMLTLELTQEHFEMPQDFSAEQYFHDYIGVMIDEEIKPERIVVRAYGWERYVLRDLPLHHSQREIGQTEEYTDFEYRLVPTSDLVRQLFARGGLQQVLKPQWLAEKMKEMHRFAANIYEEELRVDKDGKEYKRRK